MIAKQERTQSNAYQNKDQTQNPDKQWEQHKTINQQQQNLRTDSSLSHWGGGGGLNAFYWCQIFTLDPELQCWR